AAPRPPARRAPRAARRPLRLRALPGLPRRHQRGRPGLRLRSYRRPASRYAWVRLRPHLLAATPGLHPGRAPPRSEAPPQPSRPRRAPPAAAVADHHAIRELVIVSRAVGGEQVSCYAPRAYV